MRDVHERCKLNTLKNPDSNLLESTRKLRTISSCSPTHSRNGFLWILKSSPFNDEKNSHSINLHIKCLSNVSCSTVDVFFSSRGKVCLTVFSSSSLRHPTTTFFVKGVNFNSFFLILKSMLQELNKYLKYSFVYWTAELNLRAKNPSLACVWHEPAWRRNPSERVVGDIQINVNMEIISVSQPLSAWQILSEWILDCCCRQFFLTWFSR